MPRPCPLSHPNPPPCRMITPIKPATTPAIRRACSFSSPATAITTTVNSGVVAFRIEASPDGI